MYKRILVPIDGSPQSNKGIDEAISLAREQGSQIRLIHVLDHARLASPEIAGARFDSLFEQLREDGKCLLTNAEHHVRQSGIPVDCKLVEVKGASRSDLIAQEAQEWPADIIVCGTHGRHGLLRAILGSEGEKILRQSPVPVLLVPTHRRAPIEPHLSATETGDF